MRIGKRPKRADGRHPNTKHGMYGTPTYKVWEGMIQRTTNPNDHMYPKYGGRGIGVCERWRKFENFFEDMGIRPDGKSLDRIDNFKGYSPDNCRWATSKEQMRNLRTNVLITYKGETLCKQDWAERYGMSIQTLSHRIKVWKDLDRVFNTPLDKVNAYAGSKRSRRLSEIA